MWPLPAKKWVKEKKKKKRQQQSKVDHKWVAPGADKVKTTDRP